MKKVSDRFIMNKYKDYECLGHNCEQDYEVFFAVYDSVEEYLEAKALFDMSEKDIQEHARELYSKGQYNYDMWACEKAAKNNARNAKDLAREELKGMPEVPENVPVYVVGYPYEAYDKITTHQSKGFHIEALTTDKNLANELVPMCEATKGPDMDTEMYASKLGDSKVETLTEKTLNA